VLKLIRQQEEAFLSPAQRRQLQERTAAVLQQPAKVEGYWKRFREGRSAPGVCRALKAELDAMSFHKCAFCETPKPATIEHRKGKAGHPQHTFDWNNLLASCRDCNSGRQNSGLDTIPLDLPDVEPLDHFVWGEDGAFFPRPGEEGAVRDLVEMYGLNRFKFERAHAIRSLREHLTALILEEEPATTPMREEDRGIRREAIQRHLDVHLAHRGPVRGYLLCPPTEADRLLIIGAVERLPEIRTWVADWLRPPAWAGEPWQAMPA